MVYHLWDVGTRFYYGQFDDEAAVLTLVRSLIDHDGRGYADDLELIVGEGGDDNLSGAPLIDRAYSEMLHYLRSPTHQVTEETWLPANHPSFRVHMPRWDATTA